MLPLYNILKKEFNVMVIHTGQHYDYEMSKIFFDELNLPDPDYNLNIGSGTHGYQTGEIIRKYEAILLENKADIVIVFGDTNTTLGAAISAIKLNVILGHVEAGLRSYNRKMPEEINRVLTDHASNLLFAPTKTAVNNLKKEGIINGVFLTGDIMYDALSKNIIIAKKSPILEKFDLKQKKYLLATVHRQSNTNNEKNLKNILGALSEVSEKVIFPVHPRTMSFIKKYNLKKKINNNLILTNPLSYLDFLWLEKNASKIITDSGGVQKEAYMLGIPCITTRDETEWVETIENGWNILAGTEKEKILNCINLFNPKTTKKNIFGDGNSSEIICKIIRNL